MSRIRLAVVSGVGSVLAGMIAERRTSADAFRLALIFGLVILVFYAADTGTLTWSSDYLDMALDASKFVEPLGFAAYEGGALLSRFGGDHLVRRFGAVPVVTWGTAIGIAGLVTVVAANSPVLAIARMNIANYLGAILSGGLIGAAASSGHLRWAFVIPLVIIPVVLVVVKSFRSADVNTQRGP